MENVIDKLFDENNNDLIVLFNEKGEEISFEQIAIIPIKKDVYFILKPVIPLEGMSPDEGLVFELKNDGTNEYIMLVVDENIIDEVFNVYDSLIEEE